MTDDEKTDKLLESMIESTNKLIKLSTKIAKDFRLYAKKLREYRKKEEKEYKAFLKRISPIKKSLQMK